MSKRFHATEITNKEWWVSMSPENKLFLHYIEKMCDTAGIWDISVSMAERTLGYKKGTLSVDSLISECNIDKERLILIDGKKKIFHKWTMFFQDAAFENGTFKIALSVARIAGAMKSISRFPECIEFINELLRNGSLTVTGQLKNGYQTIAPLFHNSLVTLCSINTIHNQNDYTNNSTTIVTPMGVTELLPNGSVTVPFVNSKNYEEMIVIEMNKIWLKYNPTYAFLKEADFPAYLNIAYYIADRKKIRRSLVISEKEGEVLKSWDKIAEFICKITDDKFIKKLTLDGISIPKNLQKVEQAMISYQEQHKSDTKPKMVY